MTFVNVFPVIKPSVRELCQRPYQDHPRGCPNYGKRRSCPPATPLLGEALDLEEPVYAVYNAFDLAGHVARMRERHPGWSLRQARCCLYWQGTARKQLRLKVEAFRRQVERGGLPWRLVNAPEAYGVDVTATMASIGIHLEWPPETVAYQVALIGAPKA